MLKNASCGLFRLFGARPSEIGNYLLDLIFDQDPTLAKIAHLRPAEKYHYLKNPVYYDENFEKLEKNERAEVKLKTKKRMVKISPCPCPFYSFGHHLSGANFHAFSYHHDEIQNLIWQMKFKDNHHIAKVFGYCLAKNIYETARRSQQITDFCSRECILVPMPVHYRRFFERGYNQCNWLCREILKSFQNESSGNNQPFPDWTHKIKYNRSLLRRTKYTKKQSQTQSQNRAKNIRGVFRVTDRQLEKFKGANVILIDDVFTTGATINEASRVLREAGFENVISFTIAR